MKILKIITVLGYWQLYFIRMQESLKSCGFIGCEESNIPGHIILKSRSTLGTVGSSQSCCTVSARRTFVRWECKRFKVHWSVTAKNVTCDGEQQQASAGTSLTGGAEVLHSASAEQCHIATGLNGARAGSCRAEITCASCRLNHCLQNGLFLHMCGTTTESSSILFLVGKQPTFFLPI